MFNHSIECEFCFHAVGHGLFYTAKVDRFWFVYDCGSSSAAIVQAKVKKFCQTYLPQKEINGKYIRTLPFLFLSHLHYDHVSGLEAFFAKKDATVKTKEEVVKINYVFLPYLSPWERVLLAVITSDRVLKDSHWYLDLLRDPVKYLTDRGVDKIVVVTHQENAGNGEARSQYGSIYVDDIPVELNGLNDLDEAAVNNIFSQEQTIDLWANCYESGRLRIAAASPEPNKIGGFWEFVLYQMPMPDQEIARFREWISSQDCAREYGDKPLALLSDRQVLKELKRRYRKLPQEQKDINLTSLVLWHGPVAPNPRNNIESLDNVQLGYCCDYSAKGVPAMLWFDSCHRNTSCSLLSAVGAELKGGQLLTGDLNFKLKYCAFKQHFGSRLASTFVCLAPHHGSKKSWNEQLLQDVKPAEAWVVSAGTRRGNYPRTSRL